MSEYVVDTGDVGSRLDVALTRMTGFSRSHVVQSIRAGTVFVNGTASKPSRVLEPQDRLLFAIAAPPVLTVEPQALPIDIVFEDEAIIVVNKAPGMVTHPAHGSTDGTLVNALLAHVGALPGEPMRAGLVHRLDRDTSGLLLVAKTDSALATLGRAMQKRYIEREYRGIVAGHLEDREGTIRGALGRDPRNRQKYAVRAEGKPAVTHFALREKLADATELTFRLETGRTHQIRVHLATLGHAIVNDAIYGRADARSPLPGQALHAWRLAFKHPVTKEYLQFEAPPTAAYEATLDALR